MTYQGVCYNYSGVLVLNELYNSIFIPQIFPMNKTELIDAIAEKADVSKKDTDAVLTATINAIMEAVASGDKISLIGFGSFEPRERKARDGRNPQTGETIKIPATTVPAFSAGKGFKQMVSGAKD